MRNNSTVLVTGVGGPAGRASATYFAARGYCVVGADARDVDAPCAVFRRLPLARDPDYPQRLLELATHEHIALVLPTVTEELPIVARMRAEFRALQIAVCVSEPGGVDVANDKWLTSEHLRSHGVSVPMTLPSDTPGDVVTRRLGYPLVSKPRFGRGGRGVVVHQAESDLAGAAPEEVVWQTFLGGEEFDVNLFAERGGRAAAIVVLRKTRLKQGLVGNAISVERTERPDVACLGERVSRVLGLEGPIDIDIRLGADGVPAVLDVNARVGANVLSAPEVLDALDDAWRNGRCA